MEQGMVPLIGKGHVGNGKGKGPCFSGGVSVVSISFSPRNSRIRWAPAMADWMFRFPCPCSGGGEDFVYVSNEGGSSAGGHAEEGSEIGAADGENAHEGDEEGAGGEDDGE